MKFSELLTALNPLGRKRSFALNELDRKLEPYLGHRGGFFIEAGANDGIAQSNTLYYERYYGWTGLLVEAIPELARRCRQNRPGCRVENCALVPFDYTGKTVEMHYCNLMSLVKGAMKSEDNDLAHVKLGSEVQQLTPYKTEAPARTLTSILDEYKVGPIDFLSLDVEGFETQVFRGLDWERHAPAYILVEARFPEEIDEVLRPRYDKVGLLSEHDVLYRRRQRVQP
jgi:FkbM family methyltransferase